MFYFILWFPSDLDRPVSSLNNILFLKLDPSTGLTSDEVDLDELDYGNIFELPMYQ
jgi:hypothetical protein